MGASCRVVTAHDSLSRHAIALVRQLEARWSRFLPHSEISAVNAAAGRLTVVSDVTYDLIAHAERARRVTGGVFNPLMLGQIEALGYDRSWPDLTDGPSAPSRPGTPLAIELYPDIRAVRLPDSTRFDPGGIGKGLAADMVAAALAAEGASSVQIELGGDVRLMGPSWTGGDWIVEVDDSDHGAPCAAAVSLPEGGVATSSVVRRRWRRAGEEVHHLLDPLTGRPAVTDLDAVTVVAPTLWWAEVVAKVALISGSVAARALMADLGVSGLLVTGGSSTRYDLVSGSERAA
jgi:thiamine biosynthesis lipoprotein